MTEERPVEGLAQQLEALQALHDLGTLTDDELAAAKGRLLGQTGPTPTSPGRSDTALDDDAEQSRVVAAALTIGSGAALIAAALLPWMTVLAPFAGRVTTNGVENGGDGIFVIGGGVAVLMVGLDIWLRNVSRKQSVLLFLIAAIGAVVLWGDVMEIQARIRDAKDGSDLVSMGYGAGLYVWGLALLGLAAGAAKIWRAEPTF